MIHKYKLSGYNVLLDTNSGGVHIIDDLTYDMLDNVAPPFEDKCPDSIINKLSKVYDKEEIAECYDEIVSLYNDKILFSEDDYEKFALTAVASPIKAMCLHIAHDCNLRCKYVDFLIESPATGSSLRSISSAASLHSTLMLLSR